MKILLLIIWLIAGLLALLGEDVTKVHYFLVWICLILQCIKDIICDK